jgi:hypothetical protein
MLNTWQQRVVVVSKNDYDYDNNYDNYDVSKCKSQQPFLAHLPYIYYPLYQFIRSAFGIDTMKMQAAIPLLK